MSGFPLRYVQVITLGVLGLSPRAIAEVLGCSENTAKVYLSRGRKQGIYIPRFNCWDSRAR